MKKRLISLRVDGKYHELAIEPRKLLVEFLREDLGLMSVKVGCEDGACGTCTVLLNGESIRSCLLLAVEAESKDIVTIEGLAEGQEMHPMQRAFVESGAVQCGFCTPGMVLVGKALLDSNPSPTEKEIREAISGNLCRCTGYVKIVEAIIAVGQEKKGE